MLVPVWVPSLSIYRNDGANVSAALQVQQKWFQRHSQALVPTGSNSWAKVAVVVEQTWKQSPLQLPFFPPMFPQLPLGREESGSKKSLLGWGQSGWWCNGGSGRRSQDAVGQSVLKISFGESQRKLGFISASAVPHCPDFCKHGRTVSVLNEALYIWALLHLAVFYCC